MTATAPPPKIKKSRAPKAVSKTDREAHLARVEELDRWGWTQQQIATETDRTQACISIDLKIIRARHKEAMLRGRDEMIAQQLVDLRAVRKEAWAAYFESMKDAEKEVEEYATLPMQDGNDLTTSEMLVKRITTREGRLPANCYLQTILQTHKSEREMLGLDEAVKQDVRVQVFDWTPLTQRPVAVDPVTVAIKALEASDAVQGAHVPCAVGEETVQSEVPVLLQGSADNQPIV